MNKYLLFGSILMSAAAFGAFAVSAQGKNAQEKLNTQDKKILVAYYSRSGHTKDVAEAIHKEVGGDIFEIKTVETYPEDYDEMTKLAKQQISDNYRPQLALEVSDMATYDIVFVGSPNWWGTITPPVSSFLASYDLKGKTVVPFITHGGGGEQNTVKDLTAQCTGCNVIENGWVGFGGRTFGISRWLKNLGFN